MGSFRCVVVVHIYTSLYRVRLSEKPRQREITTARTLVPRDREKRRARVARPCPLAFFASARVARTGNGAGKELRIPQTLVRQEVRRCGELFFFFFPWSGKPHPRVETHSSPAVHASLPEKGCCVGCGHQIPAEQSNWGMRVSHPSGPLSLWRWRSIEIAEQKDACGYCSGISFAFYNETSL
jgi:hypothetical protein